MSELAVGSLAGLAANSYVIDVASGSQLTQPGMVLQVVRVTDATDITTTSTSYADSGVSITITPNSSTSTIYVYAYFQQRFVHTSQGASRFQLTDSSDVALSGAEEATFAPDSDAHFQPGALLGYDAPASTSAQTYKLRFKTGAGTTYIQGATQTTQLVAMEVAV